MKLLFVTLLALFLGAVLGFGTIMDETRVQFLRFQKKYNKTYVQAELGTRYANFKNNLVIAAALQAKDPSAKYGITQFMDLSQQEFASQYLTAKFDPNNRPPLKDFSTAKPHKMQVADPDPTNYDWNSAGVITPVYNQGQCGSCWAFSATETIESYWCLAGNSLTQLSMEQIVDCDTTDDGCGGGETSSAYSYVQSAGGLDSYSSYPYTAEGGQAGSCQFNSGNVVATISGQSSIDGESGLYSQLSSGSGGPVSVCVDASSWQYYSGGILTTCGSSIDHCVQATGYANYGSSGAYWIVRNSWGQSWGESGYIWIEIGQDLCAIGDDATVVSC